MLVIKNSRPLLRKLANFIPIQRSYPRRSIPICLFCYHKIGTVLLNKVFTEICEVFGWKGKGLMGRQTELPSDTDVIGFGHSLIDLGVVKTPFVGAHFIRDPRDIVVSGYLYHLRTTEEWCLNTDFSLTPPILFPRVPYSQEHRSEHWKINYLKSLGNKSYQQNLLGMSQKDGLLFEMNHYGAWTIESMKQWEYGRNNVIEVRFEELMENYDAVFSRIFKFLDFSDSQIKIALRIAAQHDLRRKSEEEISEMDHVYSRNTTRWQNYFEEEHKRVFRNKFGNILLDLGYEDSQEW